MASDTSGRVELRLQRSTGFTLDVAFDVPSTGITILFGPSGCGKTTVLRCVAGLETASGFVQIKGQVWQDDAKRIFRPTYQRRLGYVFQEASLFSHLNVDDNLRYGLKRIKSEEGEKRLQIAVELLGIGDLLNRRVSELSGGERQRCAIARALAVQPDVLLMDEPLAALDPERRREILPWLEKLRNELAIPVLYVTHSEEELLRLGDNVALLRKGRLEAFGPVAEVSLQLGMEDGEAHGAVTLFTGNIAQKQSQWSLMQVHCQGLDFWLPDNGQPIGNELRLRVPADGVTLSQRDAAGTSVQNAFDGTVKRIVDLKDPSQVMVEVDVHGQALLAAVTKRAVADLALAPGKSVWAYVKSASILR